MRRTGKKTEHVIIRYDQYDKMFDHAIFHAKNEPYIVLILMDRTEEFNREEKMKAIRSRTVEVTQQVIDDQMRTVQEIASLLGETTAKSKVALTKLKQALDEPND